MNRYRRRWLAAGLAGAVGYGAWRWRSIWPQDGVTNPCLGPLPPDLARHLLVEQAWAGLDPQRVWDGHVHFFASSGAGHADGIWPHWASDMQAAVIANAACTDRAAADFVGAYLGRLLVLLGEMPPGYKAMLLALDVHRDERGEPVPALTHFSVANDLCAEAAMRAPDRLEWIASIHPHRADAIEELARVKSLGARAVKWIPSAQGIDPASARCDAFYAALAAGRLPLLTHIGEERATPGDDELDNPLRLRRALDHGVRVIGAHCATMGRSRDLDRGPDGPMVDSFSLFERLMDEPRYDKLLVGDLAAIPQLGRTGAPLRRILERGAPGGNWSRRLLHGSDYPLPGLLPLYAPADLVDQGLLDPAAVEPLVAIRRHNPLLFDFVLKRSLRLDGRRLADDAFHTRDFFMPTAREPIARMLA
jgi:mannonate dehydratase